MIVPSVKSRFSPFTYVVLLGAVFISIPVTSFLTVTLKLVVCPWYVTVNVCSPTVLLSYPVTCTSLDVIGISSLVPSSYVTVIVPSLNSKFSPFIYVVLLGAFFISILATSFSSIGSFVTVTSAESS